MVVYMEPPLSESVHGLHTDVLEEKETEVAIVYGMECPWTDCTCLPGLKSVMDGGSGRGYGYG